MPSFKSPVLRQICLMAAASLMTLACAQALACEPPPRRERSSLRDFPAGGFVNPSPNPAAPVHLPANAAGVLYHANPATQAPAFSIVEVASGASVPVKVTPLTALKRIASMATTQKFNAGDEMLFRVGPAAGFEVGKHYQISARFPEPSITHVVIDAAVIDLHRGGIQVAFTGQPNREIVVLTPSCWTVATEAVTHEIGFALSPALMPYRDLLFAFTLNQGDVPWGLLGTSPNGSEHIDLDADRRAFGVHNRIHYAKLAKPGMSAIAGVAGFLEIDDEWHATPTAMFDIAPAKLAARDSLDMLRAAISSGNTDRLRAQIARTPYRQTDLWLGKEGLHWIDEPQTAALPLLHLYARLRGTQRHDTLVRTLATLAQHPQAPMRLGAVKALGDVMNDQEPDLRNRERVARTLSAALNDQDASVRAGAADGLLALGALVDEQSLACKKGSWKSRCFRPDALKPAIPMFVATLSDPDWKKPLDAQRALLGISRYADLIMPALLTAAPSEARASALDALVYQSRSANAWLLAAPHGRDPRLIQRAKEAIQAAQTKKDLSGNTSSVLGLPLSRD